MVCLAQHIVVGVVCRGNLQTSCTKLYVYIAVLDDGNDTSHEWYDNLLASKPLVLGVFGVDTHRGVAHDGLRARGGYHCIVALLVLMDDIAFGCLVNIRAITVRSNVIFKIIELGLLILVDNLLIAECSLGLGVPVYHAQSAVDKSLVVEVNKNFDDALRALLIHGECGAVPIA